MSRAFALALACVVGVVAPRGARAHGLDPASLALHETAPGRFDVEWRASALRLPGADVQPQLPSRCRRTGTPQALDGGDRVALRWAIDCGPDGLDRETVGIADLAAAKINGLLTVDRLGAPRIQTVLSPRAPSLIVPARARPSDLLRTYVDAGLERALAAGDHLFALFGIVLLAAGTRRLPQTLAAFALGCSLALALAALGATAVPARPVGLAAAAGVLLLAAELARTPPAAGLARRRPWLPALALGLLHGLGFAATLSDGRLPATALPTALAAYNAGIGLAQSAVAAAILTGGALLARTAPGVARRGARPAVYAMGILGAYWCFERLALG